VIVIDAAHDPDKIAEAVGRRRVSANASMPKCCGQASLE
jgi:hypothetical protein